MTHFGLAGIFFVLAATLFSYGFFKGGLAMLGAGVLMGPAMIILLGFVVLGLAVYFARG